MAQGTEIREGTIEANGLRIAYLEAGEGPLALLLHGFPDNAWTWEPQIPALTGAGYRVVAPFMRGYAPTALAPDGRYDPEATAGDAAELIRALDGGPAHVVGSDWGGFATYGLTASAPDLVRRAAVINVGHPQTLLPTILDPEQVHHIFHFWFFQQRDLAVEAVRANDFAFVDYLWRYWSVGPVDAEHVARVKRALAEPGVLEAALSYYSALLELPAIRSDAAEGYLRERDVPTLAIFGAEDPPRLLSEGEERWFTAGYRRELVPGAGHFVHREAPEHVNRLLVEWFAEGASAPAEAA